MTHAQVASPPILRTIPLPGDRMLVVRPEQPGDAAGLAELYDRMSDDERYCRFFTAHRPPDAFVEKMTRVFERHGVGIVAELIEASSTPRLVGEASYELIDNGDGELGIAVDSGARGWLGPYLLDVLVEQAASRGVPNLEAEVLMANRRMTAVLRSRGMVVLDHYQSPATVRVSIAAAGRVPSWPGNDDRPRLLVEVPGGQWALSSEMERRNFQVIACPGPDRGGPTCGPLVGIGCPLAAAADAIVVVALPGDHSDLLLTAHSEKLPEVPLFVWSPGATRTPPDGDESATRRPPGVLQLPTAAGPAGDMLTALVPRRPR